MAETPTRSHALDHVVVVLFENRSLDNVLGHLYGPGDGKTFDGVIGKDLSNPIPEWAEHGADRKVVPDTVATDMDSPNPDSGEEYFHTNTQLFNTLDEHNRFKIGEGASEPWNAPPPGCDADHGWLRDRLHLDLHRGSWSAAHLRRVQPDHDRLHPRAAPGTEWSGPRLQRVRPLVLRSPLPDVHEPIVLDSGHVLGTGGEQPIYKVDDQEHRGNSVRAPRSPR